MNEIIVCRDCVSSDCTGCNMLVLYHALEQNRFKALMNENRHLNIDTDVAPVQHGRWIDLERVGFTTWETECSCCGVKAYKQFRFCPNCGALMDKDSDEE